MKMAELFEELVKVSDVQTALSWTIGTVAANWKSFEERDGDTAEIKAIIGRFYRKEITDTECNIELKALMTGKTVEETEAGSSDLDALIDEAIDENPAVLEDYRKNEKAANRIIGTVMKKTGGKYSSSDIVAATKRLIEKRL